MLIITNDKLIYSDYLVDNMGDVVVDNESIFEIEENKLLYYINEEIRFSNDLTFGRFFELLLINRDLINIIYHISLGGLNIDEFVYDFYNIEPESKLFHLEVSWFSDNYVDDIEDTSEMNLTPSFSGYGRLEPETNTTPEDEKGDYGIGISLTKIGELKNVQLKLNNGVKIYNYNEEGINIEFYSDYLLFTLNDVIHAILSEITIHGSPQHRENVVNKLAGIVEDINTNGIEMVENVNLDQMKIDSLEFKLEEALKNEEYEKASIIRDKINDIKKNGE